MESKKNKKADLSKKSILFFQLGLIIMLFVAWQTIEWKTFETDEMETSYVHMDAFEEEEIPITVLPEVTPPPPAAVIPEKIEVIDDERDVIESVIESTESSRDQIVDIQDIEEVQPEETIDDYNISTVEEVPVFPGCEGLADNEERKICMNEKITKFVGREFRTSLGSELNLTGIHKIYVQFRIEADGTVTVIGARGPHPRLEQEAIRVAKLLPEMQPGKQGGKAVGVIYSLPITFKIQE